MLVLRLHLTGSQIRCLLAASLFVLFPVLDQNWCQKHAYAKSSDMFYMLLDKKSQLSNLYAYILA